MRASAAATGLLALVALAAMSAGALGTFSGANGRVAFVRDGKVFTVRPDGRDPRRLTPRGGNRAFPRWSADGSRIAFGRFDPIRGTAIFVMRASGAGVRRVSPHSKRFVGPVAWRPRSLQMLYVEDTGSDADPRVASIKLARADGSAVKDLTGDQHLNTSPSWSPDGRRIAFVRDVDGDPQGFGAPGGEIWVMDADGSSPTQLTHNAVLDESPAWAPDAARIAFTRTVGGADGDTGAAIWTFRPDGTGERQLTSGDAFDEQLRWAPNGRAILFTRIDGGSGRTAVFTIRPDGSRLTKLATRPHTAQVFDATWSPDSRRVLIGDGETITVMRADGTGQRKLARGNAFMDWQAR